MKLTIVGAARQVTGSMYLLEFADDFKVLVDCGTDIIKDSRPQEYRQKSPEFKGRLFPFEPSLVNLVVLTHAHIDHSGQLPNLIREGFEGQIVCTQPTYDLSKLLLFDSAGLHRRRLNKITGGKKNKKKNFDPEEIAGLYLEHHVEDSLQYFVTLPVKQRIKVKKGLWLTFIPSGHLLGAVSVVLEWEENGSNHTIGFSGDLGRYNYTLLPDPEPFPEVDYLITESTYGGRNHKDDANPVDRLAEIIDEACVQKPGRLIIPAFSVGRSQCLLYTLNRLYRERDFPPIKVFSDSPLALRSLQVYQNYKKQFNKEALDFLAVHEELFDFANLTYVEDSKESKALNDYTEPCIIISSSGMISGGRVEHHIKQNIQNPYATILMVGYSSEGTVGYSLMNNDGTVEIAGQNFKVLADIKQTDVFSGHAGQSDLVSFVKFQKPEKVKKIFLTHGDVSSMEAFAEVLNKEGYNNVLYPAYGDSFELN